MSTNYTKQELKDIRMWLPEGWKEALATEFKKSEHTIQGILFGRQTNNYVCARALEMASEEKKRIESLKKTIA